MKILSVGDQLLSGHFNTHSKFKNVINFTDSKEIISLVTSTIGKGPNNIVVSSIIADNTDFINITEDQIQIKKISIDRNQLQKYNSTFVSPLLSDITINNLMHCENYFLAVSSEKSLAYLLNNNKIRLIKTSFEKALALKFIEGANYITCNNFIEMLKTIRGLGIGLTPSGDDFICGFFYALHFLNRKHLLVPSFLAHIKTKNLISNTFMLQAFNGFFYEHLKKFVYSLGQNNNSELEANIRFVLEQGETSGEDMLTGFLYTLKHFTNDYKSVN